MTRATPVNLLTGFLGSGKTTVLRRLLQDPALSGAAVLINEFGEVGLDHHLVERIDETTVLLQSGCVCCTISGELSEAMLALETRRARGAIPYFDRLVIESTGLADPFPILSTIRAHPVLRHHFTIGPVVTTVDAVNAPPEIGSRLELVKQIAAADRILVTKTDLIEPAARAALFALLPRLNPTAEIRDVHDRLWSAEWLMIEAGAGDALERADFGLGEEHSGGDHDPNRHGAVRSFAVTVDEPLDWSAFGIWLTLLLHRHGSRVLRVKAMLNILGEDAPVAVHGVQHLVHPPVHMARWPDSDRRSHLVFIVDGLEPALVRRSFETFCLGRHDMRLRPETAA